MFNFFSKLNIFNNINYQYYFEYIKYLNFLNYTTNINNKILYFKNIIKSINFINIKSIDKNLLNMSNWNLNNSDNIKKNLLLINNNLTSKEYQIFIKIFFDELYSMDLNFNSHNNINNEMFSNILFNYDNIPILIEHDIINIDDILKNINPIKYHNFITNLYSIIVFKLNDKDLFNKYVKLLNFHEEFLFINYEYLIDKKFITTKNLNYVIENYSIEKISIKYRFFPSIKYNYSVAYINIIVKFKKSLTEIKNFMNKYIIKNDYDFLIAKHWNNIMPSYNKDFDIKTNIWLNKCIKYKS